MINQNTARADIFKEFYDLIKDKISGLMVTVSFVDEESKLPQLVINAPTLPRLKETYDRYNRSGDIEIDIYAKSIKTLTNIYDEVESLIISNKLNLSVQSISINESTLATIQLSQKQVHTKTMTVSFTFRG